MRIVPVDFLAEEFDQLADRLDHVRAVWGGALDGGQTQVLQAGAAAIGERRATLARHVRMRLQRAALEPVPDHVPLQHLRQVHQIRTGVDLAVGHDVQYMRGRAALRQSGVQFLRARGQHLVAHRAHDRNEGIERFAGEELLHQLRHYRALFRHRVRRVGAVLRHELKINVVEMLRQSVQLLEAGIRVAPGHARGQRAADARAYRVYVFQHAPVDAAPAVAVGDLLAAVYGHQDVRQSRQNPVGQAIEQGAVGLQLETEAGMALHHRHHQIEIQRRLAAVEGDLDLVPGQVRRDESVERVERIADLALRTQYLAHAERAVAAFEIAAQRGEQLQFYAIAQNGWSLHLLAIENVHDELSPHPSPLPASGAREQSSI